MKFLKPLFKTPSTLKITKPNKRTDNVLFNAPGIIWSIIIFIKNEDENKTMMDIIIDRNTHGNKDLNSNKYSNIELALTSLCE